MILAAGRGERMRPLTDVTPKPLLTLRGQPLIERLVIGLVGAGISRIVINLAWLGVQIRDYLGDGARFGAAITYSEERPQALETAGGIFRALPLLSPGPFVVVNGDVFTGFPYGTLGLAAGDDAHLVMVPNPSYLKGDFGIRDGRAIAADLAARFAAGAGVDSVAGEVSQLFTFSGIGVYSPAFFDGCVDGAYPLKPLMLKSMARGRCSAELWTGLWEEVGTPQRLLALNAAGV
jgi:N-acetyl-alpha-D-muramate 1-phosphate uridylyltransferase